MNKPRNPSEFTPKVTTGAIAGSRKVYQSGCAHPDLKVPFRQIAVHPSSGEPPDSALEPAVMMKV